MAKGVMRGRLKGRIGIVEIGVDQEDAFVDERSAGRLALLDHRFDGNSA
jgi:hypothetical protein